MTVSSYRLLSRYSLYSSNCATMFTQQMLPSLLKAGCCWLVASGQITLPTQPWRNLSEMFIFGGKLFAIACLDSARRYQIPRGTVSMPGVLVYRCQRMSKRKLWKREHNVWRWNQRDAFVRVRKDVKRNYLIVSPSGIPLNGVVVVALPSIPFGWNCKYTNASHRVAIARRRWPPSLVRAHFDLYAFDLLACANNDMTSLSVLWGLSDNTWSEMMLQQHVT